MHVAGIPSTTLRLYDSKTLRLGRGGRAGQYAFSCLNPCTTVMNKILQSSSSDQFSM